jgi:hypothetical protein
MLSMAATVHGDDLPARRPGGHPVGIVLRVLALELLGATARRGAVGAVVGHPDLLGVG